MDPTVGKHTAADEAVVDPLVADALQRRRLPVGGTHRIGAPDVVAQLPGPGASAVGWPEAPGHGSGLGWPGVPEPVTDIVPAPHPLDDGSLIAALEAAEAQAPPVEASRRSGWRRFFGGVTQSSSVA